MIGVVAPGQLDAVDAGEQLVIALRHLVTQPEDAIELLELADTDGRPDVVDAVVVAEVGVIEPAAAVRASLVAQALDHLPRVLVVGRDHAAFARRHLLVRVEGPDGVLAVRAKVLTLVQRAERLAGVVDQGEAVLVGDRLQLGQLARVAEDVHRDDRPGARRDRCLDGGGIHVQRVRVDVGEDRRRALVEEAVSRRREGERRGDRLVAGLESGEHAQQVQTGGARRDGSGVGRADGGGELLLEAVDRGAERQAPGAEHLQDELLLALVEVGGAQPDLAGCAAHARLRPGT